MPAAIKERVSVGRVIGLNQRSQLSRAEHEGNFFDGNAAIIELSIFNEADPRLKNGRRPLLALLRRSRPNQTAADVGVNGADLDAQLVRGLLAVINSL